METLQTIFNRTSVRQFTDREISDVDLQTILQAGMSGPSCVNARDWSFLVVRSRETLAKMAKANGRPAQPLVGAKVGILICGDLDRAFQGAPDYWVVDGAIAAQNMVLAATALGIGSVWLGTWPQMDRVERQRNLFSLPGSQVPHSILALGYPAQPPRIPQRSFEENRVHYERW